MLRLVLLLLMLSSSATAAQPKLEIHNVQAAYGFLWPQRASLDYLPGETLFFRFQVTGAKWQDNKRIDVESSVKLADGEGREVLHNIVPLKMESPLGEGPFVGYVSASMPGMMLPGDYKATIQLKDNLSGESVTCTREIRVKRPDVTVTQISVFADIERKLPASPHCRVGESRYWVVTVDGLRDRAGTYDMASTAQFLDAATRKPLCEPVEQAQQKSREEAPNGLPVYVGFFGVNRLGDLVLRMSITDRVAKRTIELEIPFSANAP